MDWFTHGLLPYLIVRVVGKSHAVAIAVLIGAMAPDLDVFVSWLSLLGDAWYPYGHRGFVHTILVAPVWSVGVWWALAASARRWQWRWLPALDWQKAVPLVAAGAWSHLLLDSLTIGGTPLLWPLSDVHFSAGWFFFMPLPVLAATIWVGVRAWRGRRNPEQLRRGLALVVAALALTGAVRGLSYAAVDDSAANASASAPIGVLDLAGVPLGPQQITRDIEPAANRTMWPAPLPWRWYQAVQDGSELIFGESGWGSDAEPMWFHNAPPESAAWAIAQCRQEVAYRAWNWHVLGPHAITANRSSVAPGASRDAWTILFVDVLATYTRDSRPNFGEPPNLRCQTDHGGVVHLERVEHN